MGRIGCLVAIIVLLVIGWDQYRIEQMRREVVSISSRFHAQDKKTDQSRGASDMVTALAETERHARRARALLGKKKVAEAQAELDKALASLRSANTVSTGIVGDAAQFLGKAREQAVRVFQKAWEDISQEAKRKKTDVEKK